MILLCDEHVPPHFSGVECGTPPEIANGERRWDSEDDTPLFETSVFYTCHEGYSLIGNSTIVCSDTGEYSPPPPECKGKNICVLYLLHLTYY